MASKDLGIGITISLRDNLSGGAKKAGDAVDTLKKKSEGSVGSLNKLQSALNAAAGSQLMSGAKQAFSSLVNSSTGFERQMAQVATQVDTTTVDMAAMSKGIQDLSVNFGTDAVEEAAGFYEVLSAGIGDANESMVALEVANRMAIGGNASVAASVDGLTTIINAWGMKASDANNIADTLFTTVKLGKLNMEDLAKNIADVAPVAASLGIDLEQVGASIATMTKQGTRAPIAFTQMKAALSGMLRPTDDLTALWKKNGFASAEAAIRAKGYQGALGLIMKASKGNKGELQKLLGGMEAVNAVLQISGDKAALFAESMDEVKKSAGAADAAFAKASDTNDFRIKQADQSWQRMKRTVGTQMLIALEPAIKKFTELSKVAGKWLDENPAWAKAIGITIAALVALSFALGVLAVAIFVVEAVSAPVILVILAIAAVIAIVIALIWHFREPLLKAWEWTKMAFGKMMDFIMKFAARVASDFETAKAAIGRWASAVTGWFQGVWNWIKNLAVKFKEFIEMLPFAGDMIKKLNDTIGSTFLDVNINPTTGAFEQKQATSTAKGGGPTPWNGIQQAQSSLLSVKNPSTAAQAPIQVQNTVNIPKTIVNPASVQIDKREIAKIAFEAQQQEGVRQ